MHEKPLPKPRFSALTAFVLTGTLLSAPALPHGGGLNSAGCHNDNINGGYHCHRDGGGESSLDADVLLGALVVAGIVCQWQPKTAHLWQLKTAHLCRVGRGGSMPLEQSHGAPVSAVGSGATGGRHRTRDEAWLPVADHEPVSW